MPNTSASSSPTTAEPPSSGLEESSPTKSPTPPAVPSGPSSPKTPPTSATATNVAHSKPWLTTASTTSTNSSPNSPPQASPSIPTAKTATTAASAGLPTPKATASNSGNPSSSPASRTAFALKIKGATLPIHRVLCKVGSNPWPMAASVVAPALAFLSFLLFIFALVLASSLALAFCLCLPLIFFLRVCSFIFLPLRLPCSSFCLSPSEKRAKTCPRANQRHAPQPFHQRTAVSNNSNLRT